MRKTRRESRHKKSARVGKLKREAGIRSRHQRCPGCGKLRHKWLRANAWHEGRKQWVLDPSIGKKVCHLCGERRGLYDKSAET